MPLFKTKPDRISLRALLLLISTSTANFATHNRFLSWWLGGLNFQIEHHLFPRISHVHYPAISQIIRETCREFNIPYLEYPRVRMAVASHVSHLRSLSRP